MISLRARLCGEFFGTGLLLAVVTGSGIMGERLAGGNVALALLANSLATAGGLYVLIALWGPVSGAHFNPVVTAWAWSQRELSGRATAATIWAQTVGALAGVWMTHATFGLPVWQVATKARSEPQLWWSEALATIILLTVIRVARDRQDPRGPLYVALTVGVGYWVTPSTFFANPAATLARSLSNTFVGIQPADLGSFLSAQLVGLGVVLLMARVGRK